MNAFVDSAVSFAGDVIWMALIVISVQNTIFSRALGASTALLIIRKKQNILLFGVVLTGVSLLSSVAAYVLNPLVKNNAYATPFILVTAIGAIYIVTMLVILIGFRSHRKQIFPVIHLAVFNSTVLGAMLLNSLEKLSLPQTIGYGIGMGIGFTAAAAIIAVSYNFLNSEHIPKPFRGFPVTMMYIGILSMAFYGLVGGHELIA